MTDTLAMAKAVYPGKRNSLDALCDRFGVDRSNRTFHGAKLDAQLLADVYINLTRGQDALLIDIASNEPAQGAVVAIDLRSFELPVLVATEHELAAHEELLLQLDKASNGRTLFRLDEPKTLWHNRRLRATARKSICCTPLQHHGAVSSGVEHSIHTAGVGGSKPSTAHHFSPDSAIASRISELDSRLIPGEKNASRAQERGPRFSRPAPLAEGFAAYGPAG